VQGGVSPPIHVFDHLDLPLASQIQGLLQAGLERLHKFQGAGIDRRGGQSTRKRGAGMSPEKKEQWSHAMSMHYRGIKGELDQLGVLIPPGKQMGK
jgi:hypothetical protein